MDPQRIARLSAFASWVQAHIKGDEKGEAQVFLDFDAQIDSPLDKVKVADLASRWGPLAFLFPAPEAPRFGNDQLAVTRKAADHLAECFNKRTARNVDRGLARAGGSFTKFVRRRPGG